MTVHPTDLKRRFALFDEAADLPPAERAAWLTALAAREPQHAAAVQTMLNDLDQSTTHPNLQPCLIGVSARAFEAQVDVAIAPDVGTTPVRTGSSL